MADSVSESQGAPPDKWVEHLQAYRVSAQAGESAVAELPPGAEHAGAPLLAPRRFAAGLVVLGGAARAE